MDEVFTHQGVTVRYKIREPKQDRRHLVVVFAGVQPGEHDFYGFDGSALDNVKGAILWIKDSFDGQNAYYACAGMDFSIERAVSALIDFTLSGLGLSPGECTLLGGSKGGSAALHLGLNHEYRNILASVPQTRIGTYTRQKLKSTFAFMADDDEDSSEEKLNDYIPRLVAEPQSLAKNIYVISSPADPEFAVHIEPLLEGFSRFDNFNLLMSDSTLVTSHAEVTGYNIPFVLSTLYALCEGLAPRYGRVTNGGGEWDRTKRLVATPGRRAKREVVSAFHWIQLKRGTITFRAYAAVLGEPATEIPSVRPRLLAVNGRDTFPFDLDAMADKTLSSKLYRHTYCNYLWNGLQTPSDRGIWMGSLPVGKFELKVDVTGGPASEAVGLTAGKSQTITDLYGGNLYHLDVSRERARLTKLSLDASAPTDGVFDLNARASGKTLHISGVFVVPREEMWGWGDGQYVLTLRNETGETTLPLATSRSRSAGVLPEGLDPDAYAWANFSTAGHRGLDLGDLAEGRYEGYVSLVRGTRVYTGHERMLLTVHPGSVTVASWSGPFPTSEGDG